MTVSFSEARDLTAAALGPQWAHLGEFYVAADGFEDEDAYLMVVGAREYLRGGDDRFQIWDAPATLVDKQSGAVSQVNFLDHFRRIGRMTPVNPPK